MLKAFNNSIPRTLRTIARRGIRGVVALPVVIATVVGASTTGSVAYGAQPPFTLFAAAAAAEREFAVPVDVILAVSYSETLWVDYGSAPSYANGFGFMHLQETHSITDSSVPPRYWDARRTN